MTIIALRQGRLLAGAALIIGCLAACTSTSTAPSCRGGTGLTLFRVSCSPSSSNLQCQAFSSEYAPNCPQQDDTADARWTVGDTTIIRSNGQGVFTAVGTGDTFVLAAWLGLSDMQPVSVFPNMPPVPTYAIGGYVWQARATLGSSPIDGAVIQILDGLVAGRTATSGLPPALLPGYPSDGGSHGHYSILGVPPGTYHLQVTKSGYVSQQATVTVGSASADFQLQPN